jgi:hypothetical protein
MSFGKRVAPAHPASDAVAPAAAAAMPPAPVRTVHVGKMVIAGAFVIAALAAAYFSPGRYAERLLEERFAPPLPAWQSLLTSFDGSVPGRRDPVEAAIHQTCRTAAQAKITGLNPKSRQFYLDNWMNVIDEVKLERVATYLGCAMSREPERLCAAPRKARLVAIVKGYYELLAEAPAKERERQLYDRSPWSNLGPGMERDWQPKSDIVAAKASDAPDHRVVTGLQALARAGLISAADFAGRFGFGTPTGITDAIGSIPRAPSTCR